MGGTLVINGFEDESERSVLDEDPPDRNSDAVDSVSSEAISRLIRSRSSRRNSVRTATVLKGLDEEPASLSVIDSIGAAYPWVDFLGNGPAWSTKPFDSLESVKGSALFNAGISTPRPRLGLRTKG